MKSLAAKIRIFILSRVAWYLYRLLLMTWEIRVIEDDVLTVDLKNRKTVIFAHWHGHELVLMPMINRYKLATMVSTSADGQIMNFAVQKMSGVFSKGSSTRQGVQALLGLVRLMRGGRSACVAVDGPKGPLHVVKPGVFELAKLTGAHIYASGVAVDRAWVSKKSWNKAVLPKPFAKIVIYFGNASANPTKDVDPRDHSLGIGLRNSINDAIQYAESQMTGSHS